MIRLDPTNAQRAIELVPGVIVTVIPLTSAIWAAAGADPEIAKGGPGREAAEITVDVIKAVARRTIVSWEGVGDLDGNPVEPSPAWINLLMDQYRVYDAFNEKFVGPFILLSAEGNGSASLRTGNSKGAKATAKTAKKPVQTALSSSTLLKR